MRRATTFEDAIEVFRRQFPERGEFALRAGESIKAAVRLERVSAGYGVYVISTRRSARREIVYIGRGGTSKQDGAFKQQGISKRLTMKQDRKTWREAFFRTVIAEEGLDALHFEWFVTLAEELRVPPFLAEAQLLASYFESFGRLPRYNRSA